MAQNAILPNGANVKIKDKTGSTFKKVNGFKSFSGIYGSAPTVQDVTDFDSTAKEKLLGMTDEGQISLGFLFIPADSGQVELISARAAKELRSFTIALSDKVGSKTYTFNAFVLTASPEGAVDTVMEMAVTLEISGAITEGVVA